MKHILVLITLITIHVSIISTPVFSQEIGKPKSLIFAVQPSHAKLIREHNHNDNIVIKLAKALNTEIEVYECPWARCIKAIENGDADVIDDLFFSTDRAVYTVFLQPSFETLSTGFRFYADNTRTKVINTWDDLIGLRIGLLRGDKHFPKFDESTELTKFDFINLPVAVKQLSKGRIDVFISPPSFNENDFKAIDSHNKMTQQPYSHIEPTPLYVGLSKKSRWLAYQAELEKHLKELVKKQGESN